MNNAKEAFADPKTGMAPGCLLYTSNLCVIIDLNGLQIDGPTSEVMPTDPVDAKMRDFG